MYVLDTNVLSEMRKLRKGVVHPQVRLWSESANISDLYLSSLTVQEIEIGSVRLRKRDPSQSLLFKRWLEETVLVDFAGRILPVDADVARRSAQFYAKDTPPYRDTLIAATAYVHHMAVVTRNVKDFEGMGVTIINPWADK